MRYDASQTLLKIKYEGGLPEAIQYGLTHRNVPLAVQEEWEKAEAIMQELDEVCAAINAHLEIEVLNEDDMLAAFPVDDEDWFDDDGDDDGIFTP